MPDDLSALGFTPVATPPPGTPAPAQPGAADPALQALGFVPEWATGPVAAVEAGALGALNYPTAGAAGHVLDALGFVPESTQQTLQNAQPGAYHGAGATALAAANLIPVAGEAADVANAADVAEAADAGGALLQARNLIPSNAIPAIAGKLAPTLEGASTGARLLSGATRGAIEGGLFVGAQTAGDAIHNAYMGDPDHAAEHILSDGGLNTLLAAGLGAAIGTGIEGAGVFSDWVKPAARKLAAQATDALQEQQGSVALDVLGVNKTRLRQLYGKGTMGLGNIKRVMGVEGDDFPEVLGKILADPKAMVPNPATGALEPLIQGGDTAVTVAEKIDTMRQAAAGKLGKVYDLMDQVGPGIRRADIADTLRGSAAGFSGDPTAIAVRNQLRRMAEAIEEGPGDTIKPTELWDLQKRNADEIFNKTGLVKQNTDAEFALRDTIKEAIADYSKDIPSLNRWPSAQALPDAVAGTLHEDLARANAEYQTWAELGRIANAGAEGMMAGAPNAGDTIAAGMRGAWRGAKGGGLLGGVAGGAPGAGIGAVGGAVGGAGMRVARDLVSPQVASRTLEAMRGLSGFLGDLAPAVHGAVRSHVPEAVGAMLEHMGGVATELGGEAIEATHPALLPPRATWDDVHALDQRLLAIANGTTPVLMDELAKISPELAGATGAGARNASAKLRGRLPKQTPGMRGMPSPREVNGFNDYARGAVGGVKETLRAIARGEANTRMVAGARENYPGMSLRADALIADGMRKQRDLPHAARSAVGLWLGRQDPIAARTSLAVQHSAFASASSAPAHPSAPAGGKQVGEAHINKISASTMAATATEGTTRRLGKE